MNIISYPPILDSYSTLQLREEVDYLYPIGTNKWIGIYDEPENTVEKYIQDSFDLYLKDQYALWHNVNPWNPLGEPIGFEWWIHDTCDYNTITYHSNHDDVYRREEHGIMRYPLLSTETYLTNNEDPTTILDTKHGDYWEEFVDFPPKEIAYSVPEEGKFLIFPSWLNHSVAPFYGPGERRTLSANFRVPFGASAKDESSGDLHFKNMFDRDSKKEPEVTADTPISDIL